MKDGELEDELKMLKKFDSKVFYRIFKYSGEWQVDASRRAVVLFAE
jgi:hypothetical protein